MFAFGSLILKYFILFIHFLKLVICIEGILMDHMSLIKFKGLYMII